MACVLNGSRRERCKQLLDKLVPRILFLGLGSIFSLSFPSYGVKFSQEYKTREKGVNM